MNSQEIRSLFIRGERALHTDNYSEAVVFFEQLSQQIEANTHDYFNIQRELVKAYSGNQQIEEAISLCQKMIESPIEAYAIWGSNFLATITNNTFGELEQLQQQIENVIEEQKNIIHPIRQKSLSEFKNYCQENLLPSLKRFERQRKIAIASIIISGILISIIFLISLNFIFHGVAIEFFLIVILIWLIYCQGCLYVRKLGYKREIINNIVGFIDDNNILDYGNKLLIEDNRNTTINFTESQLFQRGLIEPNFFQQEDCVYGTIGKTDIFFSEVLAQKMASWSIFNKRKTIFRGLFFVAKFPKNFRSRAFILPQTLQNKVNLTENWRGQLINLEDSEFDSYFRVYSYDQIESRYILSTSLMAQLVDFRKRVKRNLRISFISGHIFIAIPYHRDLFEPQLFRSMLSFSPLKEYFEILQFMIAIVEELNLNQDIWREEIF